MITIDLRGGIRKSAGLSQIFLEKERASLNEIIDYLARRYNLNHQIMSNEIMVAINGVDSSILGGGEARISSGDIVTILTVVHGG
ncbi:MoaD/ThiS family protein [Candidatus Nitrosocosmicus franklandus]|uniref:ThiS family protein n=1 Tax=Candidatus Nitrosocosmicus franklandianus TaxID=1798806 RepID=A0A484I5U8_9ARCH|nr:MoaD/ThiS family protein [Candidatus Nitrosocosmicus franklandus]VFJ13058.1 ThiS family protein [Candidatus Nitrosocosmicus franklandus]